MVEITINSFFIYKSTPKLKYFYYPNCDASIQRRRVNLTDTLISFSKDLAGNSSLYGEAECIWTKKECMVVFKPVKTHTVVLVTSKAKGNINGNTITWYLRSLIRRIYNLFVFFKGYVDDYLNNMGTSPMDEFFSKYFEQKVRTITNENILFGVESPSLTHQHILDLMANVEFVSSKIPQLEGVVLAHGRNFVMSTLDSSNTKTFYDFFHNNLNLREFDEFELPHITKDNVKVIQEENIVNVYLGTDDLIPCWFVRFQCIENQLFFFFKKTVPEEVVDRIKQNIDFFGLLSLDSLRCKSPQLRNSDKRSKSKIFYHVSDDTFVDSFFSFPLNEDVSSKVIEDISAILTFQKRKSYVDCSMWTAQYRIMFAKVYNRMVILYLNPSECPKYWFPFSNEYVNRVLKYWEL